MVNGTKPMLAIALGMSLSGCQSLFGGTAFASHADSAQPATVDMSSYFAERIEAGKIHLRNNRPTQAIVAFRQASYDTAYSADAYNGMGVAYARIGRADLAKRFFDMAVAAAPGDERYTRNLARLEGGSAVDGVMLASADIAPTDPDVRTEYTPATPIGEASESAPMRRVSEREVQIRSGGDLAGKALAGTELAGSPGYPVRAEALSARVDKTAYPVRIALSDVKSSGAPYPIRIELPKAK